MTFGFIITRHVNSEKTNKYWNQNIKLIRTFYPFRKIVIIDDNSNYDFIKPDYSYKNIIVIQSEYPNRGELLPYIYFLRNKWFDNAVILHDSVFIHKRVAFENFNLPVIPLWHHPYDKENINNLFRISGYLSNNNMISKILNNSDINILGVKRNVSNYLLCFGGQCFINHTFLQTLQNKYNITNLIHAIHNRSDRCALERIMGILFCIEYPTIMKIKSLFGNIMQHHMSFQYNYDNYINDFNNKRRVPEVFVKVWTGR